jgi:molybdenum cofactor biosynthesis enzyme MoaA
MDAIEHIIGCFPLLGIQKVDISGGEPLVHPNFQHIVNRLTEAGIFVTLTTSGVGSKVNRNYVATNTDNFSRIIFSIDGPNEFEHDTLRRYPQAWSQLTGLMSSTTLAARRKRVRVNTVVTSKFSDLWIDEFIANLSKFEVREWCLIEPHPANAKPEFEQYVCSSERFIQIVEGVTSRHPPFRVIHRSRGMYSSYWSLQPSGVLRQHTSGSDDRNAVDIRRADHSVLQGLVAEWETEVPTRKTDENSES